MAKKSESKFADLMASRRSPEKVDEKIKPIAKSKSEEYVKASIYLPKQIHRQLKFASLDEGQDMSDIVTQLVQEWLSKRSRV